MIKILPFVALAVLAGCAQSADKIKPSYVSPLQYQDLNCKQIRAELGRVGRKMSEVSGIQDKTASNDSVAMGVGLVLFWPALFFIDSSDQKVEIARLKGEFDALEQAAIQKKCDVANEIEEARRIEADRQAAKKAGQPAHKKVNQ